MQMLPRIESTCGVSNRRVIARYNTVPFFFKAVHSGEYHILEHDPDTLFQLCSPEIPDLMVNIVPYPNMNPEDTSWKVPYLMNGESYGYTSEEFTKLKARWRKLLSTWSNTVINFYITPMGKESKEHVVALRLNDIRTMSMEQRLCIDLSSHLTYNVLRCEIETSAGSPSGDKSKDDAPSGRFKWENRYGINEACLPDTSFFRTPSMFNDFKFNPAEASFDHDRAYFLERMNKFEQYIFEYQKFRFESEMAAKQVMYRTKLNSNQEEK